MSETTLAERVERFRREYLDTSMGRTHYQTMASESKEVRAIWGALVARRQSGSDVTNEVLQRLLPHANTQGNRQRGARVSTWPCITKDIRMWFEGAGWKAAGEWREAALWVMDIVDAGLNANWPSWRDLAQQPIQRGFGCGFISPIVHCLRPDLPVINSKVVRTFADLAGDLGLAQRITANLLDYPDHYGLVLALVDRLKPMGIGDVREFDIYCHWNIHKRLGGGPANGPDNNTGRGPRGGGKPPVQDGMDAVCAELTAAQHDTSDPARFEKAVAAALRALGMEAEHIGGPGEADVVMSGQLGDESFSAVVDAKTCQAGAVRSGIHYQALKKHQEMHEADYVLVVAPGFAGGNTVQFAQESQIGLLTTEGLINMVRLHNDGGLSLQEIKEVVSGRGVLEPQAPVRRKAAQDRVEVLRGVLHAFEAHQRLDESAPALDGHAVYFLLRGEKWNLTREQVDAALRLLANPLLGVLEERGPAFVLTMPARDASRRIAFLAQGLIEEPALV